MKKKTRFAAAAVLALFAGGIVHQLFWGKLFAYAPFFPGFSKRDTAGATIYVQRKARFAEAKAVDAWLSAVEETHGLAFVRKPKIFIFRDDGDYYRRSLSRTRFFTYPNGSILLRPGALQEATEGRISLEIYLKHELSHALLFQHMTTATAYGSFPRWLLEGIAVFRSGQRGTSWYPGKAETLDLIRRGNFFPPDDFGKKRGDFAALGVPNRSAFLYAEFACLVEALIESYGEDRFAAYLKRLMNGGRHVMVFREVFGTDFVDFLRNFRSGGAGKAAAAKNESRAGLTTGEGRRPFPSRFFRG